MINLDTLEDRDKAEAIENFRRQQRILGNLSQAEIDELEQFHFILGPDSVVAQVRCYYLQLKSEKLVCAEAMMKDCIPHLQEPHTEENIEALCWALYKYWSGFIIHFNGKCYTVSKNSFSAE